MGGLGTMTEQEALGYLVEWYSDIYPYSKSYDAVFDTVDRFLICGQDGVVALGGKMVKEKLKHGT